MQRIQHHHARGNRDAVHGGLTTFAVSPKHLKDCFRHRASAICFAQNTPESAQRRDGGATKHKTTHFSSASSCFKSPGISDTPDWRSVIVSLSRIITLFFVPH